MREGVGYGVIGSIAQSFQYVQEKQKGEVGQSTVEMRSNIFLGTVRGGGGRALGVDHVGERPEEE